MTTRVEHRASNRKGHKWFAALFDKLSESHERTFMKEIRPRIVGGARGRVLEIGAGTGHSIPYYAGNKFEELVITEPDPYMMQRLREKFDRVSIEAQVVEAPAEELPFPDASFDSVLSVHVFCSVQDVAQSLAEVRRVLKPGGQFRFFDHVRSRNAAGALAQDIVLPVWRWFGAGCHPNRDIACAVEKAGFRLLEHERMRPFSIPQSLLICAFSRPHVYGIATSAT